MKNDGTHNQANQGLRTTYLFGAGAVIGAAAALLFAPQSGVRTRRRIVRTYEDVKDQAAALCEDVADRLEGLRRTAARQVDAGKDFVTETRDDLAASLSELEKSLGGLTEKFRRS